METKAPKLFFSFSNKNHKIDSGETYFDSGKFDWVKPIEDNWQLIRNEIVDYVAKNEKEIKPYFAKNMVNKPDVWRSSGFYFWGLINRKTSVKCPVTLSFCDKIPHIVSASISVMKPYSEIKGHKGDTNAIYRCHFPLIVPSALPDAGFEVEGEQRSWIPGKFLIFNDAAYHRAWNNTGEDRIILIIDVIKPEYASQKRWICSRVIGSLTIKSISQKIKILNKIKLIRFPLRIFFSWVGWLYLSFSKKKLT